MESTASGTNAIPRTARAGARPHGTWQMNRSIDASLKRDVKAAAEAGVTQSAYLQAAIVRQLVGDGAITERETRDRGLSPLAAEGA